MLNRLIRAPRPMRIAVILALIVLSGATAGRALAAAAAQPEGEVTTWPLIAAALSLLAIGGVASFITALLRKAGDAGLKPQTIVYAVCFAMVAVSYVIGGGELPLIDAANPTATATGWLLLVGALKSWSEFLYDVVLKRVWPDPAPPSPAPAPA